MLTKTPDLPPISRGVEKIRKQVEEIDVASCTVEQLLAFRQQITAALPARELKDINLSQELVLQVLALQQAQSNALNSEDTPVNQLAQAMNALSAALGTLVKLQNETFTSERLKQVEALMIEAINTLPPDKQEAFLACYESAVSRLG